MAEFLWRLNAWVVPEINNQPKEKTKRGGRGGEENLKGRRGQNFECQNEASVYERNRKRKSRTKNEKRQHKKKFSGGASFEDNQDGGRLKGKDHVKKKGGEKEGERNVNRAQPIKKTFLVLEVRAQEKHLRELGIGQTLGGGKKKEKNKCAQNL